MGQMVYYVVRLDPSRERPFTVPRPKAQVLNRTASSVVEETLSGLGECELHRPRILEAGVGNVVVLMNRVEELEGLHGVEAQRFAAVDSPRLFEAPKR